MLLGSDADVVVVKGVEPDAMDLVKGAVVALSWSKNS